jgi:hypothetical protein
MMVACNLLFSQCAWGGGRGVGSLPFLMVDFMGKKISFSGPSLGHGLYTTRYTGVYDVRTLQSPSLKTYQ